MASVDAEGVIAQPKVSVIVGAYNCEAYIATALESLRAQSLPTIEALVVDDCSSDGTAAAVQRFVEQDDRFTLLRNNANLGPSAARNRAMSLARGTWIAPLDADDWYDPDRLSILIGHAEQTGSDLLADNLLVHEESTGTTKIAYPPWPTDPYGPVSASELCSQDWPSMGVMGLGYSKPLIRRDFLVRTGLRYADDIRVGEDFDLYMRCLMAGGRLFLIKQPLYHYTRRQGSLSKSHDTSSYRYFACVNQRLLQEAQKQVDRPLIQALTKRQVHLESHLSFMQFREALQRRDLRQSLKAFRQIPSRRYAASRLVCSGYKRLKALTRQVKSGWMPRGDGSWT
jgi:succinoglycan biosynthesis protein ExoO